MRSDPWGSSSHEALAWAYGVLARELSTRTVLGELRSATRVRSELSALDYRAQAALIRKAVEEDQDGMVLAIVHAYYLPKPSEQRAAGGGVARVDRFRSDRAYACLRLSRWLSGGVLDNAPDRQIHEVVTQYALRRSAVRRLARVMRTNDAKARELRDRAFNALDALRDRALARVGERLQSAGLI